MPGSGSSTFGSTPPDFPPAFLADGGGVGGIRTIRTGGGSTGSVFGGNAPGGACVGGGGGGALGSGTNPTGKTGLKSGGSTIGLSFFGLHGGASIFACSSGDIVRNKAWSAAEC